jgi:hypothetical protein
VQKEGYGNVTQDITVADTAPDNLQFKLASSAGVTINVVDATTNNPIAANATRIVDASGQTVNPVGGFFFSGSAQPIKLTLAPGTYTVTITSMGYASKIMTVSSPSQITVAMTQGGSLIVLSSATTAMRGRLVDGNGATYRGFNIDPSPLTTTINNVAAGSYTLQVLDSNGAVINTQPVTVVDGQQATVKL